MHPGSDMGNLRWLPNTSQPPYPHLYLGGSDTYFLSSSSEVIRQIECPTSGKSSAGDRSYRCCHLRAQKSYFSTTTAGARRGEQTAQEPPASQPKAVGLPGARSVKSLPAVRETQVGSLGREDPLEKDMATHSTILAWRIPWMEEPGRLQSMGSPRVTTEQRHFLSFKLKISALCLFF